MTPFWTIPVAAFRSRSPAVDKWFKNGQSDIVSHFGANAEALYRPGTVSSGDVLDEIGSVDLSPVGTPQYLADFMGSGSPPYGVGFDAASTDALGGAQMGWPDENWAVLVPWRAIAQLPDNRDDVVGRFSNSYDGFSLTLRRDWEFGYYIFQAYLEGSADSLIFDFFSTFVDDQQPHYVLFWHIAPNQTGITTDFGEQTSSTNVGTLDATCDFRLGRLDYSDGIGAANIIVGPTVIWRGAAAATVVTDRATTLAAWWAL